MKTMIMILAAAGLAASCGDNKGTPDSHVIDTANPDAYCSACPAVPSIGVQIDRMARPAVNTALNHAFDGTAAAGTAKDAYNQDGSPSGWIANAAAFKVNAAIIDVLDTGLSCNDGACSAAVQAPGAGCGNQFGYNGMAGGGGTATANSYNSVAGLLADDQLYLDTSVTTCEVAATHQNYLAVEFNVLTSLPNLTCGGRAPTNDVMDTSYTALAIGVTGFKVSDGSFAAAFGDGVPPHALHDGTDAQNDTFPFLGAPHP